MSRYPKRLLPDGFDGPCVLVTGGNGFLAYHIIQSLITMGYWVIITTRTPQKASEVIEFFYKRLGVLIGFCVITNYGKPTSFRKIFIKYPNITKVIHTSAPFHYDKKDQDLNLAQVYYDPTVVYTRHLLSAIKQFGQRVERVVLTSTIEVADDFTPPYDSFGYDELSWRILSWDYKTAISRDPYRAYVTAKSISEHEAWKFQKDNELPFTLNVILMPMAIGPHLNPLKVSPCQDHINTSSTLVWRMANSRVRQEDEHTMNNLILPCMDVSSLADSHVAAAVVESIQELRLLPFFKGNWFSAYVVHIVVQERFPSLTGRLYPIDEAQQSRLMSNPPNIANNKTMLFLDDYITYMPIQDLIAKTLEQFITQDPFEMEILRVFHAHSTPVLEPLDFELLLDLPLPDFYVMLEACTSSQLFTMARELTSEEINALYQI